MKGPKELAEIVVVSSVGSPLESLRGLQFDFADSIPLAVIQIPSAGTGSSSGHLEGVALETSRALRQLLDIPGVQC